MLGGSSWLNASTAHSDSKTELDGRHSGDSAEKDQEKGDSRHSSMRHEGPEDVPDRSDGETSDKTENEQNVHGSPSNEHAPTAQHNARDRAEEDAVYIPTAVVDDARGERDGQDDCSSPDQVGNWVLVSECQIIMK